MTPEIRTCPLTGQRVIIAPARSSRPQEFAITAPVIESSGDPFAEGNESGTPGEVFAIRDPGTAADEPGWRVRVVPNRYPAVEPGCGAGNIDSVHSTGGPVPAVGYHEVIIECPQSESQLTNLSQSNVVDILTAWRERMRTIRDEGRFGCVSIFRNSGAAAGASIAHCHSQLIATEFIPDRLQRKLDGSRAWFTDRGTNYFEYLIASAPSPVPTEHGSDGRRFRSVCPPVSRFAYEMWIIPTTDEVRFDDADDESLEELAATLLNLLRRLESVVSCPDYNLILQSAPWTVSDTTAFRWHIEILPRLAGLAGIELGFGLHINTVAPETAAWKLSSAQFG